MALGLFHDTIVAPSTPKGSSALAIIRISGEQSIEIASRLLDDPVRLWALRGGSSVYIDLIGPDGDLIDDCLIHVYRNPKSFTGEDLVEITPHGSPAIVDMILEALVALGARMAEPGEFSRRGYLNGKLDLPEIEGIASKISATSEAEVRGTQLAVRQKFDRLESVYDGLLSAIAYVDAEIDFGESDSVVGPDLIRLLATIRAEVLSLIQNSRNRRSNEGYFTISLIGPPNVGKSSVFNALLNYERSIVSEVAGTTRDYVEAFIEMDGIRIKVVDTAGIRETTETIEKRGIELGGLAATRADVTFRVTDETDRHPIVSVGVDLLHNKIDLDGFGSGLRLSALTGEGLEQVDLWLRGRIQQFSAEFAKPALEASEISILTRIASVLSASGEQEPILLSEQLRSAVAEISQLLGRNVSEESLNRIFSKLCIGK